MFFASLSLLEYLALFGIAGALLTILYLLDRTRRRQVVATLQFFSTAQRPTEARRKRRIREPLSLLLQLLALALLLAAVAELRFGSEDDTARDHVLILDASAWMAAGSGEEILMDEVRRLALGFVRALPDGDRVMVVRAGALVTPVTRFEADREKVEEAIQLSEPGSAALELGEALEFAARVQALDAKRPGEIVFAGAGRIHDADEAHRMSAPANLRVLSVDIPVRNVGLRRVGLRHSPDEADLWQVFASVRNDSEAAAPVEVAIQFSGAPVAGREMVLEPGEEREVMFPLRTPAAGLLEVRLFGEDDFADDNRAVLEVPARDALAVTIHTRRSELLRPLLSSSPFVEPVYRSPEEYDGGAEDGIVVLDGFHPRNAPPGNVVWIAPPADDSPVPVKTIARDVSVESWHAEHPLALGLDTRDLRLGQTLVFDAEEGWEAVATVEDGAVVLVSETDSGKAVLLGFHPGAVDLRFELAAPLLFANILRWFEPELFGQWELRAGSVGSSEVALGAGVTADQVEVTTQDGALLPATVSNGTLRFFAGSPGVVNVRAGDRQVVFSVALPEVPSTVWEPPDGVRRGVPAAMEATAASRELWRWLVLAGVLVLLIEWLYYGRRRVVASSKRRPLPLAGWLRSRSESQTRRAS